MILIDANIFMYAAGAESPQREPCRDYLRGLLDEAKPAACTNAEVLQEILHRYKALSVANVGFAIVDSIVRLSIPVVSISEADVMEARRLMERYPSLSARDAVHLGVMHHHGIDKILSYDRGFSQVPWAVRLEP